MVSLADFRLVEVFCPSAFTQGLLTLYLLTDFTLFSVSVIIWFPISQFQRYDKKKLVVWQLNFCGFIHSPELPDKVRPLFLA